MRTVTISPTALRQLEEWKLADSKMLSKIISLIVETASSPFEGTGKPEPLKHNLKGKWAKNKNQEARTKKQETKKMRKSEIKKSDMVH